MAITSLVDINQLTASTTKDKALLIAIDAPSGGGFDIRKLTKEDLFKIVGHALEYQNGAGTNEVITFDPAEFPSTYNAITYDKGGSPATARLIFKLPNLSVSDDGSNVKANMSDTGAITSGNASTDGVYELFWDGNKVEIKGVGTWSADAVLSVYANDEIIGGQPDAKAPAISNGGTTTLLTKSWNALWMDLSAGSIVSHTIEFPTAPRLGDRVTIYAHDGGITTLTLDGGTNTILDPFTGSPNINDGESKTWMYVERGSGFWFPITN